MNDISNLSRVFIYVILAIMALFCGIVAWWQINVVKGKAMKNPDGSFDDWHEQPVFYGIAIADLVVACPVNLLGIVMVFIAPQWGFFLLTMISFWWIWANIMTTATSLRFHKPKITLVWFISFPFGTLVGLAYVIWAMIHFEKIF